MKTLLIALTANLLFPFFTLPAHAQSLPEPSFYREFSNRVRKTGSFKVPVPGNVNFSFTYSLEIDKPLNPTFAEPLVSDLPSLPPQPKGFYRRFWDKILVKDGSSLTLGEDKVPITCIYVSGQDNRFLADKTALFPEFLIRVYLVANDFSCTGPINPGWPSNGMRRELWDTYLYYEIRDPTIMLPTEVKLRYRWAEYPGILIDSGPLVIPLPPSPRATL